MSRYRSWCFTINNHDDDDVIICDTIECTYIVYGEEIGDKGTPHLQGYVEFKDAKTLTTLKKLLGKKAHLETRRGTPSQASEYCKKDGNFFERGDISDQGKRNDLTDIAKCVRDEGIAGIVEKMPEQFIKYGRNIERLAELYLKPRTEKPKVHWLWGVSGTGKTYKATSFNPNSYYIWTGTKWWNGYRQQEIIVADDYCWDGTDAGLRYLLRLIDRYTVQVETKGGMVHVNSPVIFITCEFAPHAIFPEGNTLNQVLRRIDSIEEMKFPLIDDIYEDNDLIDEVEVIDDLII